MIEGIRFNESKPLATKEDVLTSLRATNRENLSILKEYFAAKEAAVKTERDALYLTIEMAEIYRDAGLVEESHQAFLDAMEQAWQQGAEDVYPKLNEELDKWNV